MFNISLKYSFNRNMCFEKWIQTQKISNLKLMRSYVYFTLPNLLFRLHYETRRYSRKHILTSTLFLTWKKKQIKLLIIYDVSIVVVQIIRIYKILIFEQDEVDLCVGTVGRDLFWIECIHNAIHDFTVFIVYFVTKQFIVIRANSVDQINDFIGPMIKTIFITIYILKNYRRHKALRDSSQSEAVKHWSIYFIPIIATL